MLKRIREMKDQDGFTLIELMVVVLIIAILIAIAIPTFLGLRTRAQNRSAQSSLRNALTAAKAHYTDGDSYTGFDATSAEASEPSLDFVAEASESTGPKQVSIETAAAGVVLLVAKSDSGTFFAICDRVNDATNPGVRYGQGTSEAAAEACTSTSWT